MLILSLKIELKPKREGERGNCTITVLHINILKPTIVPYLSKKKEKYSCDIVSYPLIIRFRAMSLNYGRDFHFD